MSTQTQTAPQPTSATARAFTSVAVKTAFTGQTMLLLPEQAVEYEKLGKTLIAKYNPANYMEQLLVQSIIDAEWRFRRHATLEEGLYALGRHELAESTPTHLLQAAVYLKYQRQFKDLSMQEARLRRYCDADIKELKALQSARLEEEQARREREEVSAKQQRQTQPHPSQHPVETKPGVVSEAQITPNPQPAKAAA